jgi:Predicted transcriptional regulators
LVKEVSTSRTIISNYEQNTNTPSIEVRIKLAKVFNISVDEMTPSIEAAKKLAKILDTTVGYLLGENEQADLFKDPAMLKRFQDIATLPEKEKECLLTTVDHFIKASKISLM